MNILIASHDNKIGYTSIGPNPLRRKTTYGSFVKDGTTLEYDWIGMVQKR